MSSSSATFFSESSKKGEVSELKKSLQSAEVQRDASLYRKVIQKVVSCMTLGMDLSSLFMDMIKVNWYYMKEYLESHPTVRLVLLLVSIKIFAGLINLLLN